MTAERGSLELEIVRAIFYRPGRFRTLKRGLAAEFFQEPVLRRIMEAVHRADEANVEINPLNVSTAGELSGKDTMRLIEIGEGEGDLGLLSRRLAEFVIMDRLMAFRERITPAADVFELMPELRKVDTECWDIVQRNTRKTKMQMLQDYTESIFAAQQGRAQRYGTGIFTLDRLLDGGFEAGGLVLIGGAPGCGKTAFMCNLIHHMGKSGVRVGLVEAEMTANEILQRMNGIHTAASIRDIRRGNYFEELSRQFISEFYEMPVELRFPFRRNLETLSGEVRDLAGEGCKVVFVDYLQPFADKSGAAKDEHLAIKRVSETLRALALEYQVCLVVGSSLNRNEGSGDRDGRVTMNSLYGSSSLGHDASVVLLLTGKQNDHAELIHPVRNVMVTVAKARNDARGEVPLEYRLDSQVMVEMVITPPMPAAGGRREEPHQEQEGDDELF